MATDDGMLNLDSYLDSVEELLKDTMQNSLCTPHELSLIGAHAERVLQRVRRHGLTTHQMPFSTHPSCMPSSTPVLERYPAFRVERMLQQSKESALESSSSVANTSSAAPTPYPSFDGGSMLPSLDVLSARSSLSASIAVDQAQIKKHAPHEKEDLSSNRKRVLMGNQARSQVKTNSPVAPAAPTAPTAPVAPVATMYPDIMGISAASTGAVTSKPDINDSGASSVAPPTRRGSTRKAIQDHKKYSSDILSWKVGEGLKKGVPDLFDPLSTFSTLQEAARVRNIESSKVEWTAFQITTMVASLGSADAVLGCRRIIIRLRDNEHSPSLPDQSKHPRSFLAAYLPLSSPMENLEELAPRFFEDALAIPKDNDFEYRHYVTRFCEYILRRRDNLMEKDEGMSAEAAMVEVYASVVAKVKPRTTRFRKDGKVGAGFKSHQLNLEKNTFRGFRWLELEKRFGVGILALYDSQGKYSRNAAVTIDTRDLKDEELDLLLNHLDQEGNADFQWLKRICGLINPYIEQGLKERLTMKRLSLEFGPEDRVLTYNEHTDELATLLMPV